MSQLSLDVLRNVLPSNLKSNLTQGMVDNVNLFMTDPAFAEHYRNNLISYTQVLTTGKYKISSYLDAVRYVSFKHMGLTNQDCYIRTFPDKYDHFLKAGKTAKDISSFVYAYNQNQLVNALLEQSMIPAYIMHQDLFSKALTVQAELMNTATSEKVRSDAANSILSHLKQPEKSKVEIDVNISQNSVMDELRAATAKLVQEQKLAITSGAKTAGEIAGSRIIQGEVIQ